MPTTEEIPMGSTTRSAVQRVSGNAAPAIKLENATTFRPGIDLAPMCIATDEMRTWTALKDQQREHAVEAAAAVPEGTV